MTYRIAFLSDTHLGYAAQGVRTHAASNLNERVRDGYLALNETVSQILESDVDLVIHGGDLFHRSWPTVSDIVWARQQLNRLAAADIPVLINTGNHDASNERGKAPATEAVHDPDRGIHCVTTPTQLWAPPGVDGLQVHVVSHYGLAHATAHIPEPTDDAVNIVTVHGAALLPGHPVWKCVDSPSEQPIGLDLLTNSWNIALLGHYHGQGPLPGLGATTRGQVWYAGSALRRGFADTEGPRGWLQVDVSSAGDVTVTRRTIQQRAQFDLLPVDAAGLTGEEVADAIRGNLAAHDITDAIVRQRVLNITSAHRAGMDIPALNRLTTTALQWSLVMQRPEDPTPAAAPTVTPTTADSVDMSASLRTARGADLPAAYRQFVPQWAHDSGLPDALLDVVASNGEAVLKQVTGMDDTTADLATTLLTAAPPAPDNAPPTAPEPPPVPLASEPEAAPWDAPAPSATTEPALTLDSDTGSEVPW